MKKLKPNNFQSPIPFIIQIRKSILGKIEPDIYTKIIFILNLFICLLFMLWNIISYSAITMRSTIFEQKRIPVEKIIQKRGLELGFEPNDFLPHLMTFHAIGIICWVFVFIGLILLYRKNKNSSYVIIGGTLFYIGMTVFYLNFNYFILDTTIFDKIALLTIIATIISYSFLRKKQLPNKSVNLSEED